MKVDQRIAEIRHEKKLEKIKRAQKNEVKKLNKFHKKKVEDNLQNIKLTQKNHQSRIEDLKVDQEKDYINLIDSHGEKINDEILRKQRIIEQNRSLIQEDKGRLQSELERLKKDYMQSYEEVKFSQDNKVQNHHDKFTSQMNRLNERSENILDKIDFTTKEEAAKMRNDGQLFIQDLGVKNDKTHEAERTRYRDRLDRKREEYASKLLHQNIDQQRELRDSKKKYKRSEQEISKSHNYKIDRIQNQYQNKLQQEKSSYENKMNSIISINDQRLKNAELAYKKEISKVKNALAQEKEIIQTKSSDDFYRVSLLRPSVEDKGSHYIISLEVPEHESENVVFTANKRDMRISIARNYKEELVTNDGSKNLSKRSEVFTKKFDVSDIVDHTKISRKYENGILSFKIKKA